MPAVTATFELEPKIKIRSAPLGCAPATVGLVVPTGYSFNLDGSSIYLTMAAGFLAQATNTPLDLPHQLGLLGIALLTSKGSGGVTGAGFIALAAIMNTSLSGRNPTVGYSATTFLPLK